MAYGSNKRTNQPNMSDFKSRLLQEQQELNERIDKLEDFINDSPAFEKIPHAQQNLLVIQLPAMKAYAEVLNQRVALL